WCEANGLDYILGLAPTLTLAQALGRHIGYLPQTSNCSTAPSARTSPASRTRPIQSASSLPPDAPASTRTL
ncbi:MAG: hypothetical protein ACXW3G_07890, partial [Rhodoplanes sp.]